MGEDKEDINSKNSNNKKIYTGYDRSKENENIKPNSFQKNNKTFSHSKSKGNPNISSVEVDELQVSQIGTLNNTDG